MSQDLESLRREMAALQDEVRALREQVAELRAAQPVSEEEMMVISAALAAYLGERPRIRVVRRATGDNDTWRIRSRATVTASTRLPNTRGL